ncbi:hypothetical protein PPL_11729 [Heterostelium album PN500]|uniref:Uncharacterized protein n=1 Tax=Heterostelium pallidum (strain ATCC 26659 / Pp 5 / PN500) TaxID=670386 RepID=D3BUB0_HETP5|nr:hypothetical protein PPL_11729 [Heterostelium album PN500]EFA75044.1 hypothetical protein PPL_11729 [Heterostelium album PN500]|eukprot:XP_020427178.1 hypothetical protein PPL_11729 [Heterostelium album PN500]
MEKSLFIYILRNKILKYLIFYFVKEIHLQKRILRVKNWEEYSKKYINLVHYGNVDLLIQKVKESPLTQKDALRDDTCDRTEGCSHVSFDWAARNGDMTMINLLLERNKTNYTFSRNAFVLAAKNGQVEILKYLTENYKRLQSSVESMNEAAGNGHLEAVNEFMRSIDTLRLLNKRGLLTKEIQGKILEKAILNACLPAIRYIVDECKAELTKPCIDFLQLPRYKDQCEFIKTLNPNLSELDHITFEKEESKPQQHQPRVSRREMKKSRSIK